jgi:hypothetical protein
MDDIYLGFEKICRSGTYNEIDNFILNNNIDISCDDNFCIELLAKRGDVNLLKLIKSHHGDLHYDNETVMCIVALHGYIDCLEYLINDCLAERM